MAKPDVNAKKVTSRDAASAAGKVLRDPKADADAKTAAASALTQKPKSE